MFKKWSTYSRQQTTKYNLLDFTLEYWTSVRAKEMQHCLVEDQQINGKQGPWFLIS